MRALLSLPIVGFALLVDWLRRLPGSRPAGRLTGWIAGLLILAAGVVLLAHFAQKSPQRIGMPDLAAGQLSTLQSWIIVSGHLVEDQLSAPGDRLYRLTDDRVPDVELLVASTTDLAVGDTTVSGTLQGSRPGPSGGAWTGRLRADDVLASEPPPPWPAVGLALAGALVLLARRASYPVFSRERPGPASPSAGALQVGVRRTTGQPGPRSPAPASWSSRAAASHR